ncbi:putative extracellular serine-threonine rich protein [Diplodia seriata]|uniref:Putative extracellular serine-threonine rich protein n=1 Tax=Diplodia seriata TaxID=420778 RepID=A0A0G2DVX4_9PEZI|nr:putative extracellular serine-threonine rich protein [Diplodia seriata]
MKTATSFLIGGIAAQQAAATFGLGGSASLGGSLSGSASLGASLGGSLWGGSSGSDCFSTPSNTNNECTDSQKSGWDWSGIAVGASIGSSYSGFDVSGLTCKNNFGKRDPITKRTFGSKCASGTITKKAASNPKIECSGSQKEKGFSVGEFHVSTSVDTPVEFHYGMPDGSTCKHTSSCSSGGTTVKNEQCGGATSVTWKLPDNSDNEDCEFGIHSIGWECGSNGGSSTATVSTAFSASTGGVGFGGSLSESFGFGLSTLLSVPAVSTPEVFTPSFVFPSGGSPSVATSVATPGFPGSPSVPGVDVSTPGAPVITTPAAPASSDVSGGFSSGVSVPFSQNGTIPAGFTASTVYATSVYTVTSCAPEVTNCPARSGTPAVVTSVVAISTTICPVTATQTGGASVPFGSSPSAPASSGVSGLVSTPAGSFPGGSTPGFGGFPTGSSPASSATSAVPSANCPGVLPKCLNTWITKVGCSGNTDTDCYCKEVDFTKKVIDCVDSRGGSDDEISQALSYLTGICAAFVPENPGLITNVPTTITLGVPTQTPGVSSGVSGEASTPVGGSVVSYSTSTVYATQVHTITSCAPEVTNCPARSGTPAVVTSVVPVSTTVCPVTATETPAGSAPAGSAPAGSAPASSGAEGVVSSPAASAPASSGVEGVTSAPAPVITTSLSTSTIYSTAFSTAITTDESGSSSEVVVTQTVSVGTTICPVTATQTPAGSALASSGAEGVVSSPAASGPASAPASSGAQGVVSSPAPSAPAQTTVVTSYSTSTIVSTAVSTSTTVDESGSSSEVVVTQTVSVGTTICPVTATQTVPAAPVSSGVEGAVSSPAASAPASAGVTPAPSGPAAGSSAPVPVASSGVEGVTSAPAPVQSSQPVTTISIVQTVTVPCTATEGESAGSTIPGSSTTSVISTAVTVPQVAFTTQTVTVSGVPTVQTGLAQGTPASAPATVTSSAVVASSAAVDGGYATFSSVVVPAITTPVVGTPVGTPVSTPPAYTGAASSLKSAGSMVGAGVLAAIFML